MKFHLNYNPPPPDALIDHSARLFLTGSCFSENIGNYFKSHGFKTLANPWGILFNPSNISNSLQQIINNETIDQKFIIERGNVFYSLLHHSSINDSSPSGLMNKINESDKHAADFLKTAGLLIITFGTAYAYRHRNLNKIVSNCHKLPGSTFIKELLEINEITKEYSELVQQLQLFNPGLKILFTVSPVKYLRDGLIENNLSKSVLLLSVNELVEQFDNCSYFPAYELVTDDLRDYRFYKEDMAHPSEQAIEYVWQKFSECYFAHETRSLNDKINKLNLALKHRIMDENSGEVKKLNEFIERQKEEIRKINPEIEI